MKTALFDFELPEQLIALRPAEPREAARLLVVGSDGALADRHIRDLPDQLRPGDALVVNDTKVIRAALEGTRIRGPHRSRISIMLTKRLSADRWQALARPAKRLASGDRVQLGDSGAACLAGTLDATVVERGEEGLVTLAFDLAGSFLDEAIEARGAMPLPPYIALRRAPDASDATSYQTRFARHEGAVAAPTAGLHFTPDLIARLEKRGVACHALTLHVGAGTFLPVKAEDTADHRMHTEWMEITAATAAALNAVRRTGGRIIAVGTTALRALESAADEAGIIHPKAGETGIFITPGYRFRVVDGLLTNFHLPRSTLFMLVSAFCGLDAMKRAYAHAIARQYRFYSYGDACLLDRHDTHA